MVQKTTVCLGGYLFFILLLPANSCLNCPFFFQRLEFLGDAVLDYLITVHLYNQYPGLSPGFLTDLRSASVNNDCYAHAAAKAGLNKHIIHASSEIQKQIESFVKKFEQSFSGPIYGWEAETHFPKVSHNIDHIFFSIHVLCALKDSFVSRHLQRCKVLGSCMAFLLITHQWVKN